VRGSLLLGTVLYKGAEVRRVLSLTMAKKNPNMKEPRISHLQMKIQIRVLKYSTGATVICFNLGSIGTYRLPRAQGFEASGPLPRASPVDQFRAFLCRNAKLRHSRAGTDGFDGKRKLVILVTSPNPDT
jgi:hypothetical protein